ncbi:hypothetical protein XccvBFoX4_gp89 [Xanthomonas phage FoX4]|uniref:Uncharacterized protein n=1 Tax=Xanthomonas phage FoX4 TaxID=2723900 RepID=A0A858WMR2_9CAUD|nr:hypothetical protein KNU97_gp89 [Xanthomonas phage FoX4]QJI53043.1 hypothetical protein XccvBFoX4_gp89 [Xanthomonas phage FoX4]
MHEACPYVGCVVGRMDGCMGCTGRLVRPFVVCGRMGV